MTDIARLFYFNRNSQKKLFPYAYTQFRGQFSIEQGLVFELITDILGAYELIDEPEYVFLQQAFYGLLPLNYDDLSGRYYRQVTHTFMEELNDIIGP